jgi:hypothetical protein
MKRIILIIVFGALVITGANASVTCGSGVPGGYTSTTMETGGHYFCTTKKCEMKTDSNSQTVTFYKTCDACNSGFTRTASTFSGTAIYECYPSKGTEVACVGGGTDPSNSIFNNCASAGQKCFYVNNTDVPTGVDGSAYLRTCTQCNSGYGLQYMEYGYEFNSWMAGVCRTSAPPAGVACTITTGSNPCRTQQVTDASGQVWCMQDGTTAGQCQIAGAGSAFIAVNCCANYKGQMASGCATKCMVAGCSGSGKTSSDDRTACVCAKGYYGPGGGGTCSACSGLSSDVLITSRATTQTTNSQSAAACYIPAGTDSETPGTYTLTNDCWYGG